MLKVFVRFEKGLRSWRSRFGLKYSKILTSCAIAMVGALGIASAVTERLHGPLNGAQETIVSSTTRVVVVLIPGFPTESLALGVLLGLALLMIVRRRRLGSGGIGARWLRIREQDM